MLFVAPVTAAITPAGTFARLARRPLSTRVTTTDLLPASTAGPLQTLPPRTRRVLKAEFVHTPRQRATPRGGHGRTWRKRPSTLCQNKYESLPWNSRPICELRYQCRPLSRVQKRTDCWFPVETTPAVGHGRATPQTNAPPLKIPCQVAPPFSVEQTARIGRQSAAGRAVQP